MPTGWLSTCVTSIAVSAARTMCCSDTANPCRLPMKLIPFMYSKRSAQMPLVFFCAKTSAASMLPALEPAAFTRSRWGLVSVDGILNTACALMIISSITSTAERYWSKTGCTTNFPKEDKEFLKQQYLVIPEIGRLMHRMPEEMRQAAVFKILFYHYYHFELDQPFLPQYEQNNRSLLNELRKLAPSE